MPPKGAWTAVLNICALLKTIQALMSTPNPDDPLMADIVRLTIMQIDTLSVVQ